MESKSDRNLKFNEWLNAACPQSVLQCEAMPFDASFRRYYRVTTAGQSYVAMDAPPPENCQPFVTIATALRQHGLLVPEIYAADIQNGFLLLTDFGRTTYLQALQTDMPIEQVTELYQRALRSLASLQACRDVELPPFGKEWLAREWQWHQEWFLDKWLGMVDPVPVEVDACYQAISDNILSQPTVMMHRDYHSANLMLLPEGRVGILDFQDAFMGPLTYDAASLLRDCYISWPLDTVRELALYYAGLLRQRGQLINIDDATYLRWFDWMGIQRHLKALLTFARKAVRDNQPRYLSYVPRTLQYITSVSANYQELQPLSDYYAKLGALCVP